MIAVLLTVPQYSEAFEIEIMLAALASAALLKNLNSTAPREQTTPTNTALAVELTFFVSFITASGLVILLGADWGMYLTWTVL